MARRRFRRFSRRRGTTRIRRRSGKWTLGRIVKYGVFLGPQLATAINGYRAGGGGQNGVVVAADQLSQNFSGYSFVNNQFYWGNLVRGYVPLAAGVVAGRIIGRYFK